MTKGGDDTNLLMLQTEQKLNTYQEKEVFQLQVVTFPRIEH